MIWLSSCRKDDICTEPTTPKLQIGFYDFNQPEDKKVVEHLWVIALPQMDTFINDESKDSIALPLNVNENNTAFIFQQDTNKDTIYFNYSVENVFVSKACGYKAVFHNLQADLQTDNDNWIKQIELLKNEILEDTMHIKILY